MRKRVPTSDTTMASAAARSRAIMGGLRRLDERAQRLAGHRRGRRRASTRSPMVWVVSWPFPAITTTSPGCARSTPRAIATRRSGSTASRPSARRSAALGTPATISSMMASGSSLLGLSEVTTTTIGQLAGDLAHRRALACGLGRRRSRTRRSPGRRARSPPGRWRAPAEPVGRVGVVDDDGGTAGPRRPARSARAPARRRRCRRPPRPGSRCRAAAAAVAAAMALLTLKRPPSGTRISTAPPAEPALARRRPRTSSASASE